MSIIRLKYIKRYRDRTGVIRHYFNKAGAPRTALPGLPGSAEFMAAYGEAMAAAAIAAAGPRRRGQARKVRIFPPGTLGALAAEFYASAHFKALDDLTRKTYRNWIDPLVELHGDKLWAPLDRRGVKKLLAECDTPGKANVRLRTLKMLMLFSIDEEWRTDDPTIGIKKLRTASVGFLPWEEDHIEKFEKRHPVGSMARLALALLLFTAQRRGDVVRMGWQHLRGDLIAVRQHKTKTLLDIPAHADLAAVLAATPRSNMTFLMTSYGKPFSPAGFGNWFRDRCQEAGLPLGYNAHGLRKAACRRLAEAGCTALEIMAVSGHTDIEEVERYTRSVEQKKMARAAIAKLQLSNG